MIKRIAVLLLACMLLAAPALAEHAYIGTMQVVNCQEWVSLRAEPDAASQCLVEVPLGEIVENCSIETKAFIYAEYRGLSGYIMAQYLESIPEEQDQESIPEEQNLLGDMRVLNTGAWIPMRQGPSETDTVIQWMAPYTLIKACVESLDGFVCGELNGIKGYVLQDALEAAAGE